MSSLHATLQPGLSALTDFSTILSRALGSLDENAGNLKNSLEGVITHVEGVKKQVSEHDERLRRLEKESESQRESVEKAMHLAAGVEKNVNSQLEDTAKHLHKELVSQRAITRMDMNSMKGSMSDFLGNKPVFNPNLSTNENMQNIIERMARFEEALTLQHNVNQHLNKMLSDDGGKEMLKDISTLSGELQKTKDENENLKRMLKELRDTQNRQSRYMLDVLSSLGSKQKLQNLKAELKKTLSGQLHEAAASGKVNDNFDDVPNEAEDEYKEDETIEASDENKDGEVAPNDEEEEEEEEEVPERQVKPKKKKPQKREVEESEESEQEEIQQQQPSRHVKKPKARAPRNFTDEDDEDDHAERVAMRDADGGQLQHHHNQQPYFPNREDMDDSIGFDEEDHHTIGSISLAEESIAEEKRRQLELQKAQILETVSHETKAIVDRLRMDCQQRLDELEASISTFKRIAFMIDDLKINFETVKNKVDELVSGESIEEKLSKSMLNRIANLKELWNKVSVELCFALENVNDPELDKEPETYDEHKRGDDDFNNKKKVSKSLWNNEDLPAFGPKAFFIRAKDFSRIIDDTIEDFNPRDNLPSTLKKLIPTLLDIFNKGEMMLEMDGKARQSESLDYCFDDLICSDLTPSLKNYLSEAIQQSLPVLDEMISKHRLQQKVDYLMEEMPQKADKSYVLALENELRKQISQKVDHADFVTVTSRLASSAEVQRLQSQISDSFHGGNHIHGHSATSTAKRDGSGGHELIIELKSQPEYIELLERFDSLTNKFADMQVQCEKLVPKQEVHEALKAIVDEVKNVRRNYVPGPVFKEGLKMKADAKEVEKLVKTVSEVLGDINLEDFTNDAAAIHAKCLICDKPVSAQRARSARAASANANNILSTRTLPTPATVIEEYEASRKLPGLVQSQSQKVVGSQPISVKQNKSKISTDVAIIRNSINHLPEINDSLADSPRNMGLSITNTNNDIQPLSNYKNRVRTSAGGGVGPSYKKDSR